MIKSSLKRNIVDDTLVLNMLARACPSRVSEFVRQECDEQQSDEQQCDEQELSTIVYEEHVLFDLSDTHVFVVDQQAGFESQGSSSTIAHLPCACTQESKNVNDKLKCVLEEEEEEEEEEGYKYDVYEDSDGDLEMEEVKRPREQEVLEEEEEEEPDDEQTEEEEVLHYEGDTEVEEPFQVEPNFKPSSDEEEKGLLKDSDDDGFEPLSFVPPKKRKSRSKKRPARKWYNEKMDQPHEQLCLKLCFRDHHQFRDALLNLHITQSKNFKYDRNLDQRTIIDAYMEKYGVDVPKSMAYRAKNIAIEVVLGDHKLQYPRLREYAQTVMDTNPGSRVIVTTVLMDALLSSLLVLNYWLPLVEMETPIYIHWNLA
ncbi:hypothetical protein D1007_06389 [Hordeum vulgare]|nr:hypothetical protein D1007_06389 [Hordeum vulgare]